MNTEQFIFPGSEWSAVECDALAIQYVPLVLLQEEAALYGSKYWDYRFMHPAQATQLFAHSYARAKKHAVERRTDIWVGRNMKGIKDPVIFDLGQRAVIGFWKGRQMADRMGIPYDFYCEAAMLFADVARWENLPTATQLYSDNVPEHLRTTDFAVSMIAYIEKRWLDRMETAACFATHEDYLAVNYVGSSAQNSYLNYCFGRVSHSANKAAVLSCMFEKGQVSPEQVMTAYPRTGKSLVDQANYLRE